MQRIIHATLIAHLAISGTFAKESSENSIDPKFVSLRESHDGRLAIDLKILNQFQDHPQEKIDFYIEARDAILGGETNKHFPTVCKDYGIETIGKSMLGKLTSESVSMRIQTPEKSALKVKVKAGSDVLTFKNKQPSTINFIQCKDLTPNTNYTYSVLNEKNKVLAKGSFHTPPKAGSKTPFKIAVGADFHKIGIHRPELLNLVQERNNISMMLLGDLAVDGRCTIPLRNIDYLLRDVSPVWQKFAANVPIYTSWDDHDYYGNDTHGQYYKKPDRIIPVDDMRSNWKKMWNNPESKIKRKGIYFQHVIGDAHVIMLDTRSCRVNERRGKLHSFLGKEQTEWLKKTLKESKSPFILLSGGTMWTDFISNGKDSWGTWDKKGREELLTLFDTIEDKKILLFSGDRHGTHAFKIKRPNGKEYVEFGVGTLGGVRGGGIAEDKSTQLFAYPGEGTWAFGELQFSYPDGKPAVSFNLINTKGETMTKVDL